MSEERLHHDVMFARTDRVSSNRTGHPGDMGIL